MRSTGPLPTFVTAGSVDRTSGKSTTRRGGMSRAGSMAPARQLPVPLKATRVASGAGRRLDLVSVEPGDGGGTVEATGLAGTAGGAAAADASLGAGLRRAAPLNSTMTAFARLRTDGVAGLARCSRTRAMPAPSSPVARLDRHAGDRSGRRAGPHARLARRCAGRRAASAGRAAPRRRPPARSSR